MEHTLQFVKPTNHDKLAACPFCGNKEVVYEQYEREVGPRWRVVCCGCMAMIDPGYAQNRHGDCENFRNNAAYIQNWLQVLKNDKRFIVSAAGKAEKAAKMILGIQ